MCLSDQLLSGGDISLIWNDASLAPLFVCLGHERRQNAMPFGCITRPASMKHDLLIRAASLI